MSKEVISSLHRLERQVLPLIIGELTLKELEEKSGLLEVEVLRALHWLKNKGLCTVQEDLAEVALLDKNGETYLRTGLPERRFLQTLSFGKIKLDELAKKSKLQNEEVNVSIGILRKEGLIKIEKDLTIEITKKGEGRLSDGFSIENLLRKFPLNLNELSEDERKLIHAMTKRKSLIKNSVRRIITAKLTEKGKEIAGDKELKETVVDRLTTEMIKTGEWKKAKLRSYDLKTLVPKTFFGKKQPYRRFLDDVRARLVALGFKEMTGPLVETEFWNMDALFMPQFHSARDIHDAYYIKDPKFASDLPKDLVNKVRKMHEQGMPGSKGWRYKFSYKKTSRHILRSHDTSISPRVLSSKELMAPGKYFQIARCFRYDVIDATHNADFDQIGGFVIDSDLNLRHLFGLLRLFAKEFCGTDKIRVVPSYFPFTEPSVGLYAKHPQMGWIELAGAGIFRPEMTRPLGVEKQVIAWGIGLGRVAMFKLKLQDIRQLYSQDLEYLRTASVI